eukprot:CAMPEP_0170825234 /NCGR_PEP_ID=MMETSP0733-20121128/45827_1 /TAXON_ID=186038 /ORGANISM="Fragilariopsis kerguelensis, Strain L26-C5" /LENGTH=110 /DNA_ID=CAMNT_0011188733 /DNA_START=26 /DNA_END=358 /DNA_ORIENTATION=-
MRSDALNLEMPDFLSVLLVRVPARLVRLVRLVVPRELALDEKRLMSESRRLPPPMETVFNESRCCRTLKSFTADPTSRFIFGNTDQKDLELRDHDDRQWFGFGKSCRNIP